MNIYEAITENILKRIEEGVLRNLAAQNLEHRTTEEPDRRTKPGVTARTVLLPEVIKHARRIADYLWRSETADSQFWTNLGTNTPHVYDSVVVLERWIDQQTAEPIPGRSAQWTFLGLRWDRPNLFAFAGGFLFAVLFFLPEILG